MTDTIKMTSAEAEAHRRAAVEWSFYPPLVQHMSNWESLVARHLIDVEREASEMDHADIGGES